MDSIWAAFLSVIESCLKVSTSRLSLGSTTVSLDKKRSHSASKEVLAFLVFLSFVKREAFAFSISFMCFFTCYKMK